MSPPRHGCAAVLLFLLTALAAAPPADAKKLRLRHHGDPRRALGSIPATKTRAITPLPTTWCGAEQTADVGSPLSNAPQIKVIYAYASNQADRFSSYASMIQSDVNLIRQRFDADTGATKSVRFDLGNVAPSGGGCGTPTTGYADIQVVHLPQTLATYTSAASVFTTLKSDILTAIGPPAPGSRTDYVVYADKIAASGAAGEADTPVDDSKGYRNGVNHGPNGNGRLFAIIYGRDAGAPAQFNGGTQGQRQASLLHELLHTQGAVQDSAPHSTGAGHCYDERDIMCYNDGGPRFVVATPCANGSADGDIAELLDCGGDDYFNPNPAAGSYLATRWNAYDSIYLCPVTSCDTAIGSPTVALDAPSTAFRGSNVTFTANAGGAAITRYEWDVDADGRYDYDTGTTNTLSGQFGSTGARTIRVRASTADSTFATDARTVTIAEPAAPTPSFSFSPAKPAPGAPVSFDASATSDPSGVITNYKWDLDGDGTVEFDGGTSKTASATYAAPGTRTVTLEVDYPLGMSKIMLPVAVVAPAPPRAAAPTLTGTVVRLGALLKRGLPLTVTCGAACTLTASLRAKNETVGSLRTSLPAAGRLRTAVTLAAAAKRRYRRASRVKLALRATVSQTGYAPLTLTRSLTIRRS